MTTNIWLVSVTHSDDGDVYYAAARTREELMFALHRAVRAAYGVWLPSTTFGRRFVALIDAIPRELPDLDTIERAWPLGSPSLHITLVEVATNPDAEERT